MAKKSSRTKKPSTAVSPRPKNALSVRVFEGDAVAKDFLRSPKTFAKKIGVPLEAFACPPEVHKALKRGESFARQAKKEKLSPNETSVAKLKKLASSHFGRSYEASFIPFGMQFREKMRIDERLGITATGTASVTWLDSDADVDG